MFLVFSLWFLVSSCLKVKQLTIDRLSMEKILVEFIDTLDASFKKMQAEIGNTSGVSQLTISQFQYIDAIYKLEKPTITEIQQENGVETATKLILSYIRQQEV